MDARTHRPNQPHRWVRWLLNGCVVLILILAASKCQTRNMLQLGSAPVIPSTTLMSLDGDLTPLSPTPGKKTLVYFFAPWCEICRASIGNLEQVDKTQFDIIRIALDYESEEQIRAFVKSAKIKAPVFVGTEALAERFQVEGYPTYYLLDEDFKVIDSALGYSSAMGLKLRTWLAT